MMNTFIQFYEYEGCNNILWLRNSFSSVWKVIKDLGNIIWIDPNTNMFPNVNGNVYISCTFEEEIIYLEKWMKLRPDLNFIVGGPSIVYSGYNINGPNFHLEDKTMYELLNIDITPDLWDIDLPIIPPELPNNVRLGYSYALSYGHRCYWGKCIFCKTNLRKELILDIKKIPDITSNYTTVAWLNTQAITPKNILDLFPNFNKQNHYSFYVRGDKAVLNILDKVDLNQNLLPVIGVEFPSDRMLTIMNKGTDVDTMLKVITGFSQSTSLLIFTTINGWPNLTNSDVDAVEYFLSKIESFKKKIICINHWLFRYEEYDNTILHKTKYGKPYYVYKLDKNQEELNNRVLKLYQDFGFFDYKDHLESKSRGKVNEYGID